jgi:hypothetical protein
MKVESEKTIINKSSELVFDYISNCNNFGKVLPEQIKNWQSTEDQCSFEIEGMAKISLLVSEKNRPSKVVYTATADKPFGLEMVCDILFIDDQKCEVVASMNADIPPMIAMMAKKPLQNFADRLVVKLKHVCESM